MKNNTTMKVSVVIPLYNAEQYIGRCIDTVLQQSYQNTEIVIVDDASSDASLSVVQNYQARHPSVCIISHRQNKGTMISRRDGYMAATGDYLTFVDADDTLPPYAIERMVDKLQETNADIVTGNAEKIYVNGYKVKLIEKLPPNTSCIDMLEALLDGNVRRGLWGRLYRTSLFRDHQLINLDNMTIYEDACLLFQVVVNAHVTVAIDSTVYLYYENKLSSTQRVYGLRQIESIIMANKIIAEVCRPYSQIHARIRHHIARTILALYSEQIPARQLRALLRKHGMQKYGDICATWKDLNIGDFWFAFKRYFYVRTKLTK